MKKRFRTCLTIFLILVLAVSGGMLLRQQLQYHDSAKSYEYAASLAGLPPAPAAPAVSEEETPAAAELYGLPDVDLAALQQVNSEVVGWICIPDTELSYPLLQGEDNDYYLTHTWDRVSNSGGSIFIDRRCAPDFSGFNTIIYGHRMGNDSMFGSLKYYREQDFWREHPSVYLVDGAGVHVYDIFAAWEPSVTSDVYQKTGFATDREKQEFIRLCREGSQLETGVVPGPEDKLLTLSTCTGRGHATRWVVQAVERDPIS